MEKVAALAARLEIKPDFIFHSEKLRAQQTAEILAHHLGLTDKLQERQGLGPLDPVAPVAQWLEEQAAGFQSLYQEFQGNTCDTADSIRSSIEDPQFMTDHDCSLRGGSGLRKSRDRFQSRKWVTKR